jgi:hypothetical protein
MGLSDQLHTQVALPWEKVSGINWVGFRPSRVALGKRTFATERQRINCLCHSYAGSRIMYHMFQKHSWKTWKTEWIVNEKDIVPWPSVFFTGFYLGASTIYQPNGTVTVQRSSQATTVRKLCILFLSKQKFCCVYVVHHIANLCINNSSTSRAQIAYINT